MGLGRAGHRLRGCGAPEVVVLVGGSSHHDLGRAGHGRVDEGGGHHGPGPVGGAGRLQEQLLEARDPGQEEGRLDERAAMEISS